MGSVRSWSSRFSSLCVERTPSRQQRPSGSERRGAPDWGLDRRTTSSGRRLRERRSLSAGKVLGFETRMAHEVTEWEPPHRVATRITGGLGTMFRTVTLTPTGSGTEYVASTDIELRGFLRQRPYKTEALVGRRLLGSDPPCHLIVSGVVSCSEAYRSYDHVQQECDTCVAKTAGSVARCSAYTKPKPS